MDGKPDITNIKPIDLEKLTKGDRMQRIIFETARDVYDQIQLTWKGGKALLLAQLVQLVETFISRSNKIHFQPSPQSDLLRKTALALRMTEIVQHLSDAVRFQNSEHLDIVLDQNQPIRSTGDMNTWYTSKPCNRTKRSHINFCVCDST